MATKPPTRLSRISQGLGLMFQLLGIGFTSPNQISVGNYVTPIVGWCSIGTSTNPSQFLPIQVRDENDVKKLRFSLFVTVAATTIASPRSGRPNDWGYWNTGGQLSSGSKLGEIILSTRQDPANDIVFWTAPFLRLSFHQNSLLLSKHQVVSQVYTPGHILHGFVWQFQGTVFQWFFEPLCPSDLMATTGLNRDPLHPALLLFHANNALLCSRLTSWPGTQMTQARRLRFFVEPCGVIVSRWEISPWRFW